MRVIHRLVGYDRQSDRMKMRFDIPKERLSDAKKLAHVPDDDPDASWSYPLTKAQARRLAALIDARLDPDHAEYFLEAFADPAPNGSDR
jgi:hypothetical protein